MENWFRNEVRASDGVLTPEMIDKFVEDAWDEFVSDMTEYNKIMRGENK